MSQGTTQDYSPEAVAEWMDAYAQAAYEAYKDSHDRAAPDGHLMPHWSGLADSVRAHWRMVGLAVLAVKAKESSDG